MMQTEVGEVFEAFTHGHGASSTMPQKRNPVSCELMIVAARAMRQHVAQMLDGMLQDHERASGAWHLEWLTIPQAFINTSGSLSYARELLDGLEINTERMRANLDVTNGMIVSEAVMMGLAPHMGRQFAPDVVYDACRVAAQQRKSLYEVLSAMPRITELLSVDEIREMCDPANYVGLAGEMVDRILAIRDR